MASHFHPPARLLIPGTGEPVGAATSPTATSPTTTTACARLSVVATSPRAARTRGPFRAGDRVVLGQEASAALMAERLVLTLEVSGGWRWRASRSRFQRRVRPVSSARHSASSGSRSGPATAAPFDDAFVDALCEPPGPSPTVASSRTSGHGAIRRAALASVLTELGYAHTELPDGTRGGRPRAPAAAVRGRRVAPGR